MTRCLQPSLYGAAVVVLLTVLPAQGAGKDTAIKSILPHEKVGQAACYEGTFSGQTIDMEDWSHTRTELVPNVEIGGGPATRPVPAVLLKEDISRVTLLLTYRNRQDDGSFDFGFTVRVAAKGLKKELFARSGCAWSSKDEQLDCWIECDGGGMPVERVAGTESVNVRFSDLAMQAGCDGGGAYRVGTDRKVDVKFRLEKAPLHICKPLKAWEAEQ